MAGVDELTDKIQNNKPLLVVRYAKRIPIFRYIIPFSYGHNGKKYDEAVKQVEKSDKWIVSSREDLVPSHEEDLYDHIYSSIIDSNDKTNIGVSFHPDLTRDDVEKKMVYQFVNADNDEIQLHFSIVDFGLYIFKTGIGLYAYDIRFTDENIQLSADELIVFQNRFKELNVLRGFVSEGKNHYMIYPEDMSLAVDPNERYYVLAEDISRMLNGLFGDVFYYPPRLNELFRLRKIHEIDKRWQQKRNELEGKKVFSNQKKFKRFKDKFDKEKEKWHAMSISQYMKNNHVEIGDGCVIVPDKALLFSYVVFNSTRELCTSHEKREGVLALCKNAYYLTRGYKSSYRVADDAENERSNMFERHENDYWDASLEGAGDFVLVYDNLKDDKGNDQYHHFFDSIRANEMCGDYFILYVLLLYQHYSIVYYSRKIAETVPGQIDMINDLSSDNDALYLKLRELKRDLDLFLANSLFEAVGQITDVCNLYSYIESKLQIKKNILTIKQGIDSINGLCDELIKEKEKKREEENKLKEKKRESLITYIGILAIISILCDAMALISWVRDDWMESFMKIFSDCSIVTCVSSIVFCIITVLAFAVFTIVGIKAIMVFNEKKK